MSANFVIDNELAEADSLEYISKSRVKEWLVCEWRFFKKYVEGKREPENEAMERGSTIHETFEDFYHNAREHVAEHNQLPNDLMEMLPEKDQWVEYQEPYITNFIRREEGRKAYLEDKAEAGQLSEESVTELWLPVEIESEAWLNFQEPPWMGYADVMVHAESMPTVLSDEGIVIIDFKTGNTPDETYREKGIYLEGEFYAMLFEDEYEVAAVAGYYPKDDDLLISPLKKNRRDIIRDAVSDMVSASSPEEYEFEEQPLCAWGAEEDERCPYYEDECESTWAEPVDNKEKFVDYCERGMSSAHIAMELDTSVDAVKYWARKLNKEHLLMDM